MDHTIKAGIIMPAIGVCVSCWQLEYVCHVSNEGVHVHLGNSSNKVMFRTQSIVTDTQITHTLLTYIAEIID